MLLDLERGKLSGSIEPPYDRVVPGAKALLESLRGVGYSPWAAIADLVDNSITAGARRIHVDFVWRGLASYVRILDDGPGMDESALVAAMRPGNRSPTELRSADDLGRFGLGLKTASFSQCRLLSVISKREGKIAARRWDLDYIARQDDWRLLVGAPEDSGEEAQIPNDYERGTLVLWSRLDRLMGSLERDSAEVRRRFFETAHLVERHLAMIFHRFLEGTRPPLELFFNGSGRENRVRPWDPFMQWHPATIATPSERLVHKDSGIEVQGFVLPFKDMLSPEELEAGGGPEGWLAHQGFFIYRNRRLLVSGGWPSLGMRWTRDEVHRLARLRLDLPNSCDDDWKIDIKKSSATPPHILRSRLRRLAERVRTEAREVLAHRGGRRTRSASGVLVRAWTSVESPQGTLYKIDRKHPSIKRVLEGVTDQRSLIEEMLRVIEATVPVQRIWLDTAQKGDLPSTAAVGELDAPLTASLRSLYFHMLRDLNLPAEEARKRLLGIEPFSQYPAAINALPENAE